MFLAYVSVRGRALIDRELYLPASWTGDRERCEEAGIGAEVEFATKPVLAQRMLERLLACGVEVGWFTADEAYGDNPGLREWLENRDLNYVMAVSCDQRFTTPRGPVRADELARTAPRKGLATPLRGLGSKGHRLYDWLLLDPGADEHLLLVRRSISKPSELGYYICHTRHPVPLAELGPYRRIPLGRGGNVPVSPRTRPGSTTTRFASTTPGISTSPYPCSRPRSLAVTAHAERVRDEKRAPSPRQTT